MMPPSTSEEIRRTSDKFPGRVLVVDDEALVRWSLATGLREAGFETETVSSGAEAVALAQMIPHPDAVVLDSRLHECDTTLLLRQLRIAAPQCRFLVMTTERHETAPPEFDAVVIRKPFDLGDVVRMVDRAVAGTSLG
jgi:DNA-binding NtrC family response regulator